MWPPRSHVQLVDDSRTEQAHRAGHDGSLWQCSRLAFRTSRERPQQSQRWRKRQQWSSWQVVEEKIPTSIAPGAASTASSIEGAFLCVGVQWNAMESNFLVSFRASSKHCFAILGCSVSDSETRMRRPRLWLFTRLLVACLFTLRQEVWSLVGYLAN